MSSTSSAPKLLFLEYEPFKRNPLDRGSLPANQLRFFQSIADYFHVRLIVTDNLQAGGTVGAGTRGRAYDLTNPVKQPTEHSKVLTNAVDYEYKDTYKTWSYVYFGKTTAGFTQDMAKARASDLIAEYNNRGGYNAIARNCQTFASELAEKCVDTSTETKWMDEYITSSSDLVGLGL